jgi:hypothetical protein
MYMFSLSATLLLLPAMPDVLLRIKASPPSVNPTLMLAW